MTEPDDPTSELPDVPSSSEEVPERANDSTPGTDEPERLPEPRAAADVEVHEAAPAPHAARFQFLFGALAAVAIVAIGAVVFALTTDSSRQGSETVKNWSSWKPADDSIDKGAEEIAAHVAPRYKMNGGVQLVAVDGGPLTWNDPTAGPVPMKVALREPADAGGEIVFPKGDGVLYRLCGLGKNCSFDRGKPSAGRALLLNREALELALYSFRYLDDVDQVVVFLPPIREIVDQKSGKRVELPTPQPQALHFERKDVEALLNRPLSATVSPSVPTIQSITRSPDAGRVQSLTTPNRYDWTLEPANGEAQIFVVLEPMSSLLTSKSSTGSGSTG